MPPSLLYHNNKGHQLSVAVTMARRQFESAFQKLTPVEARFNPTQRPNETSVAGLDVTTHRNVPVNYIRIVAKELTNET